MNKFENKTSEEMRADADGEDGMEERERRETGPQEKEATFRSEISDAMIERLGLGPDAEEIVDRAREKIAEKASDPREATELFEHALEYYSTPEKKLAETPVYHSTGSYGLAKILESGMLSSVRNKVTGEQATTGRDAPQTSLVVGGYDSSETVSYAYARLNERRSKLGLDKHEVMGTNMAEEVVGRVFDEMPDLDAAEQQHVRDYIEEQKRWNKAESMSDEDFLDMKVEQLAARKYFFDEGQVQKDIDGLRAEILSAGIQGKEYRIPGLEKQLETYEGRLDTFRDESGEMREAMSDPFPVMLTYEGSGLPEEDLTTPVSGLICERQTRQAMSNAELKQIRAPKDSLPKVREWIDRRIASLPEGDPERQALENVDIVPLEYFEAKRIIEASAEAKE